MSKAPIEAHRGQSNPSSSKTHVKSPDRSTLKAEQTPQCHQTNVSKAPIEATAATAAARAPRVYRKPQWRRRTAHRGPRALVRRVECTWKSCKGLWWGRRRHSVWHTRVREMQQLVLDLADNSVHLCSASRHGHQLFLRLDDNVAQLIQLGQNAHLHLDDHVAHLMKLLHDLRERGDFNWRL